MIQVFHTVIVSTIQYVTVSYNDTDISHRCCQYYTVCYSKLQWYRYFTPLLLVLRIIQFLPCLQQMSWKGRLWYFFSCIPLSQFSVSCICSCSHGLLTLKCFVTEASLHHSSIYANINYTWGVCSLWLCQIVVLIL